ncbi:MAG: hypothetical protein M3O01_09625, partial [Pseudomonadota bacterium]|nr:hypothetical protein [Pseudomonadota bacterium]
MRLIDILLGLCAATLVVAAAQATPIVPTRDDEVVDVLPALPGNRAEEKRLRGLLTQQPTNQALALATAKRYLRQAHSTGDPRFAGMAMSAIAAWTDEATMPDDILMMRATLQQYLHDFDTAAASLQKLVKRPSGAANPQAWLTLATVRRVQGRYLESDAACAQVARAGATLHASACAAENLALRGDTDRARA